MRIKLTEQDSEPSDSREQGWMTYVYSRRVVFELLPLLFLIAVPLSVHAGVFTSLIGALGEEIVFERMEKSTETAQSVPLLKAALHTDPNPAKGGGDILVDDGALISEGRSSEVDSINTRTANGEISVYVVREGDTLSQIASMFDVSASTILWANDIERADLIQPGHTLVILPITGISHVVKSGDTLASIAKKYDGDAGDILAYNQLASATDISVGDTIVVPGGMVAAPTPVKSTSPARSSTGTVVVSGGGSSGFSHPLPGSVKTQGIHGYNGVDLAAPIGTPVLAAASGEVIVSKGSGWNGGYGNYVVVKHTNGTQTLYAHLSSNAVGVGTSVKAGSVVGYVGSTGRSTGAHLHFEVRGAANPF